MIDKIGREIEYLRLSVTDRCNLRCQYCMSERNMNFLPKEELLTVEEIKRIVTIFSKIGIKKIRLTGGEPLVRKNFTEILENLHSIKNIEEISMTTNGLLLEENFDSLRQSAFDAADCYKKRSVYLLFGCVVYRNFCGLCDGTGY